jgi:micrococcal nuclease
MNSEPKQENVFESFLSGLGNDIATKDTSLPTVLKWVVLLVVAYVVLPLTIVVALWYVWKKTTWTKSNRVVITATIVFVAMWMVSLRSNQDGATGNGVPQPDTRSQSATEAPSVETPALQEFTQTPTTVPVTDDLFTVVGVTDGDTIRVDINGIIETIRLIGMDTPEIVDPRKPVQCFGKESSDKAREMLGGKRVRLEADPTQGERDTYGRLLRFVFLEDGTSFDQWMIAEGYAHEYTYQSNPYKYQAEYKDAEKTAREGKKGLWADDTCKGDTVSAAVTAGTTAVVGSALATAGTTNSVTPTSTDAAAALSGGVVKKSATGICHAPGTTSYAKTKSYTAFDSIDACKASGGRLPKR